ncbi:MAG: hypothetical protein PHU21_01890 [Elusimicrobia bacterium]|nr:hypothetical protein [Elusimicrobiota bacterium]
MRPSILAVLLIACAGPAAAGPDEPLARAQASFRNHLPGQPYAAQAQARLVQEGCAAPCSSAAEVRAYLGSVAAAARSLGLSAELAALREHYAPGGRPRLRAQAAATSGPPAEKLAAQRAAFQSQQASSLRSAARLAEALDQRKKAESLPAGGRTAALRPRPPDERQAALDAFRRAPAGDSPKLRSLAVKSPPAVSRPALELSTLDRALLWVDERVGAKNLERASNFSAGFGDALTFGATGWVRKKINGGTDPADRKAGAYGAGTVTGLLYSLALGGAGILKPMTAGVQTVTRWAPAAAANGSAVLKPGQFVIAGTGQGARGALNWCKAGGPELLAKYGRGYLGSGSAKVSGKLLRYPIAEEGRIGGTLKGLMGQRVYTGPTIPLL